MGWKAGQCSHHLAGEAGMKAVIIIATLGTLAIAMLPYRLKAAQFKEQTMPEYKIPVRAIPYLETFSAAERKYNLPTGLLVRMAKQESNFDPNAKSPAGAIGLMQIIPRWHPTVNPWNPVESIWYAGHYVRQLYDQFGSWEQALAAYNWGPGNQAKDLRDGIVGNEWPTETKNYVRQIGADVVLA